jgi:SAM-dependent methyltransferase
MELGPAEFDAARAAILGADGAALLGFMAARALGEMPAGAEAARGRAAAAALGWIDPATGRLTQAGGLAADSCREHRFWRERGRRLPFEGAAPHLAAEHFRGRDVLEIGCGMGANLMSLAGVAGSLAGIEPVGLYRQLGAILGAREGLAPVEVRAGSGEAIPAPDASADIVLCVTAHQYMEIGPALAEMARVLRPGGELILIGGTLGTYLGEGLRPVLGALGAGAPRAALAGLRACAVTVANTLGYMAAGRRPIPARGPASTARPVYPTTGWMLAALARAGLEPVGAPVRLPPETCFRARRPGGRGLTCTR